MNLLALRSHNSALVLDLLRTAGAEGISRLELAERTGLTPQAVSKITARLREDGLAVEAGRRASTGGKPRTVLRLVPEAGHAVGVHLDRDGLRAVLADLDGRVVAERRTPLDLGAGAEAVLARVAAVAGELVASHAGGVAGERGAGGSGAVAGEAVHGRAEAVAGGPAVEGAEAAAGGPAAEGGDETAGDLVPDRPVTATAATAATAGAAPAVGRTASTAATAGTVGGPVRTLLGVGVALPGPLDHARGVLHRVTGYPDWDGFPLRDALADRLGAPVVVDKDTNAAALGLAVGGEGGSFAYLHLGTGLGAGLVIGGSVHRGPRTGAGEFGHQVVQLDGPRCPCGDRGCIEALCLDAVARGDTEEAARVLGTGAANLVGLLDIDRVLLGGRTIEAAPDTFVRGVRAVLDARARRTGDPPVTVRLASGRRAGDGSPGGGGAGEGDHGGDAGPTTADGAAGIAEGAAQLVLAPVFGRGDG
ncbi:ROK family transcriptional regulator [Streptomyces sp. bgisy022]|uniref:ROK family transcriptional regulator n=1 Tax=Streptomyces sp. bgisy022 TaxID=3413769 RepID=UPI003D72015A